MMCWVRSAGALGFVASAMAISLESASRPHGHTLVAPAPCRGCPVPGPLQHPRDQIGYVVARQKRIDVAPDNLDTGADRDRQAVWNQGGGLAGSGTAANLDDGPHIVHIGRIDRHAGMSLGCLQQAHRLVARKKSDGDDGARQPSASGYRDYRQYADDARWKVWLGLPGNPGFQDAPLKRALPIPLSGAADHRGAGSPLNSSRQARGGADYARPRKVRFANLPCELRTNSQAALPSPTFQSHLWISIVVFVSLIAMAIPKIKGAARVA